MGDAWVAERAAEGRGVASPRPPRRLTEGGQPYLRGYAAWGHVGKV